MPHYFINLILCAALTLILEFIPIVIFLKISPKYFVAVNMLTNVVVNTLVFIFDICSSYNIGFVNELAIDRMKLILVIEIVVVISEIVLYYFYLGKKQLFKIVALTIIANLLSYFLGNNILSFYRRNICY